MIKNCYEIIIKPCFIHIKYYKKIIDIDSNKIIINTCDNSINITGTNLIISAMDEYEIVIKGIIKSIEFINE